MVQLHKRTKQKMLQNTGQESGKKSPDLDYKNLSNVEKENMDTGKIGVTIQETKNLIEAVLPSKKYEQNIRKALEAASEDKIEEQEIDLEAEKWRFWLIVKLGEESAITRKVNDTSLRPFTKIEIAFNPDKKFDIERLIKFIREESIGFQQIKDEKAKESLLEMIPRLFERMGKPLINKNEIGQNLSDIMQRTLDVAYMSRDENAVRQAEERNIKFQNIKPQTNDLLHGTDVDALPDILEEGILCDESRSGNVDNYDAFGLKIKTAETTFFADLWSVKSDPPDYSTDIDKRWIAMPDNDNISLVVRPKNASIKEKDIVSPFNFLLKPKGKLLHKFPEPLMPHTGVYVGLPSTDICAIIAGGNADVEKIKHTLVSKERYVPVFDTNLKPLFSYEEYKNLLVLQV